MNNDNFNYNSSNSDNRRNANNFRDFVQGGARAATLNPEQSVILRNLMTRVFAKMFAALLLTSVVAMGFAFSGLTLSILKAFAPAFFVICIAQFGLAMAFSVSISKSRGSAPTVLFYIYSLFTGITLSTIFYVYSTASILYSFGATALVFGAMALWGATTKRDLTPLGTAGYMLLFGAIIISLINFVLHFFAPGFASVVDMALNYVILAIFVGITAYDVYRVKNMAAHMGAYGAGPEAVAAQRTISTLGAFHLYLDFINIFIRILAIFGNRRD